MGFFMFKQMTSCYTIPTLPCLVMLFEQAFLPYVYLKACLSLTNDSYRDRILHAALSKAQMPYTFAWTWYCPNLSLLANWQYEMFSLHEGACIFSIGDAGFSKCPLPIQISFSGAFIFVFTYSPHLSSPIFVPCLLLIWRNFLILDANTLLCFHFFQWWFLLHLNWNFNMATHQCLSS